MPETNLNRTLNAARKAADAGNFLELKIAFGLLDLELSNGAPLPADWLRAADNPDSVKSNASDATKAAFLLAADAMNRFGLLAHADPGVKPELAAKINNWQQDLSSCDWPILGYDTSDPPATGSVKTWTYSQVNPGGADVSHGFTFTGTDDEWAEHLGDLPYQGIEPYNAKITAPVTALDNAESKFITVHGIRVSREGYAAAPKPIGCPGHDDGTDCEDDNQNPCKACFLFDEQAGESRYWWDDPLNGPPTTNEIDNPGGVLRYTIIDASNSFHESQGLTESELRSQLRRLGYTIDNALPIEDVIEQLEDAEEGLSIEPLEPDSSPDDGYADMARRTLTAGLTEAERAAAADLADQVLLCGECSEPIIEDDSPGVLHHYSADSPTGIDHDADEDHTPLTESSEGD